LPSRVDQKNTGVFFPPDITINALRDEVIALVARYRAPAIYSDHVFAKSGGLAFYGAHCTDLFRRAFILRGEKPEDLPFQQPTKYPLIINLKPQRRSALHCRRHCSQPPTR
jgi:putative ABC transport system substrate-binding protein